MMRLMVPFMALLSLWAAFASADTRRPGLMVVEALHRNHQFYFERANQMRRHPMCAENIQAVIDAEDTTQATLALTTAVHECGHAFNGERSQRRGDNPTAFFAIREKSEFACRLHIRDARGRMYSATALALNQIQKDQFSNKRPACKSGERNHCDWYAPTYILSDMGKQGLDFVLEELNQYIHSLETANALKEFLGSEDRISARDSLLTFMWYTERYLAFARQHDPTWYTTVIRDECWSRLVVSLWDHAQQVLGQSADENRLDLESDKLATLVADPLLAKEVQLLRQLLAINAGRNPASKTHR